jgi:hypothetical protein
MLVEFKTPWFAPSENIVKDKIQHISGRRYKAGVHEIDDDMKDFLPNSAKILKEAPDKEVIVESTDIKDFDQSRSDGDRFTVMAEEAEAQEKKNKVARMAHARAAIKKSK